MLAAKTDFKEINTRLKLFISMGFAFVFGLLNTLPFLLEHYENYSNFWLKVLFWIFLFTCFWMVVINCIWFLENKYSILSSNLFKVLLFHLLLITLVTIFNAIFSTWQLYEIRMEFRSRMTVFEFFITRVINGLPVVVLLHLAVWGVGIGLNYYQKYQERTIRASQLETQLAQAQLETLKTQLQPHFLFNTLNGIVGLIRNNENQAAIETITELSALLRYVVENAGRETVSLQEEIEFNKLYLDLHQKRFSDRMRVEMEIAPETLPLKIPNLILQPLVENAILHGIAKSVSTQEILIKTRIEEKWLKLTVKNGGTKLTDDWRLEKGVGLTNTFSRLEKIFQNDFVLEIKNHRNRFIIAEISLPLGRLEQISK